MDLFFFSGKHMVLMPCDEKNPCHKWVIGGNTIQNEAEQNKVIQIGSKPLFGSPCLEVAPFEGHVDQLWFFDYIPDQILSLK